MNIAQHLLTWLIRGYRWLVSPALVALFSPQGICRYTPSCSEYALEAVRIHGACRGGWFALRRLLRCHPWGCGGHDPVPRAGAGHRTSQSEHLKSEVQNPKQIRKAKTEATAVPARHLRLRHSGSLGASEFELRASPSRSHATRPARSSL